MAKDRTKDLTRGTPWKVIAWVFTAGNRRKSVPAVLYTGRQYDCRKDAGGGCAGCGRGDGDDRIFCAVLHSGTDRRMWNFTGTGIRRGK